MGKWENSDGKLEIFRLKLYKRFEILFLIQFNGNLSVKGVYRTYLGYVYPQDSILIKADMSRW